MSQKREVSNFFAILVAVLSGIGATYIVDFFKGWNSNKILPIAFMALGFSTLLFFLLEIVKKRLFSRFEEKISGIWLEDFLDKSDNEQLSIGVLNYDSDSNTLVFYGNAYSYNNEKVRLAGNWQSYLVSPDPKENKIHYNFNGTAFLESGVEWGPPGVGIYIFFKKLKREALGI